MDAGVHVALCVFAWVNGINIAYLNLYAGYKSATGESGTGSASSVSAESRFRRAVS